MKRSLLLIAILCCAYIVNGQQYLPLSSPKTNYIADLALIYQGGIHRPDWTKEQIAPYVYRTEHSKTDFLFDGFLFIEFKDGKGKDYSIGYEKEHTGKVEWSWLLDRNFEEGKAISALNEVLADLKKQDIKPVRKRKVVLTLPEPIFGQQNWGVLKGKALDFNKEEDRMAACKWYIDDAIQRWKKAGFDELELAGFYWVAEQSSDGQHLIPLVGEYIRKQKLKFYWIPYWKAEGHGQWREAGFDAAYQQPNHFFEENIPDSRLDEACAFGKAHAMGMELEFDMRVEQPNFEKRLQAYIQAFDRHNVWSESAVAYYEGGDGIMKLATHQNEKMRGLYNQLADIIVKRQKQADRHMYPPKKKIYKLSKQEKKDGFELLFDGRDLNKWTSSPDYDITDDGYIRSNPQGRSGINLYTKEEYADFVYRFEFRLTPGANNGIGIRAPLEGDAAYNGMEIQVLDNDAEAYKELAPYQYHGSVYGIIPALRGYLKPVGEWNEEEIRIQGNQITVMLNGKVILDGDLKEATKNGTADKLDHPGLKRKSGHIGFLGHGTEVFFRNVRVKRL